MEIEERKQRLRLEEGDKIRKAKAEEDERNRQFQLEEARIRENAREHQDQVEIEMQKIRAQTQNNAVRSANNNGSKEKSRYVIEIGKWKPDVTDLNTFLCNFETSATALEVTGEMKALELTRCLVGTALELIQNLSQEERLDYEAIKRLLQQGFR